jgi:hypothetical protein
MEYCNSIFIEMLACLLDPLLMRGQIGRHGIYSPLLSFVFGLRSWGRLAEHLALHSKPLTRAFH